MQWQCLLQKHIDFNNKQESRAAGKETDPLDAASVLFGLSSPKPFTTSMRLKARYTLPVRTGRLNGPFERPVQQLNIFHF